MGTKLIPTCQCGACGDADCNCKQGQPGRVALPQSSGAHDQSTPHFASKISPLLGAEVEERLATKQTSVSDPAKDDTVNTAKRICDAYTPDELELFRTRICKTLAIIEERRQTIHTQEIDGNDGALQ